jgi:hypothetical protein
MPEMPEQVFAIHDFEREHEDEISFLAGEPILVLEKDEKYNDGWWQVNYSECVYKEQHH